MQNEALQQRGTQQPSRRTVQEMLTSKDVLSKISQVLPKTMTPQRLAMVCLAAYRGKQELMRCTPESVLRSMMRAAQFGVEPDGHHAHLVAFGTECTLMIDYKGLLSIARNNGITAKAILVREFDVFEYIEDDGSGKTMVKHNFDVKTERGNIVGVYCRWFEDGNPSPSYEYMTIDEVESIRQRSKSPNKGPWVTDFGEMVKKTVIHRAAKQWDLKNNPGANTAIAAGEDENAANESLKTQGIEVDTSADRLASIANLPSTSSIAQLPPPNQGGQVVSEPARDKEQAPAQTTAQRLHALNTIKTEPAHQSTDPSGADEGQPSNPEDEGDGGLGPVDAGSQTAQQDPPPASSPEPQQACNKDATRTAKQKQQQDPEKDWKSELMAMVGEVQIPFSDFVDIAKITFRKELGGIDMSNMDYKDLTDEQCKMIMTNNRFVKLIKISFNKK